MAKPIISKFSVIDADQNNTVSYVCYDDTVDEVEYVIYDNASGNIIVDQTVQTSGASSMRTFTFPAGTIHNRLLPYYIKLGVHNQNGETSELSDAVLFYCHEKPTLKFNDVSDSESITIPFPAYSFDATYLANEEEGENLTWYKYALYDSSKKLLTSEIHYGSLSQSFITEGLDNNGTYYVRATGETINSYFLDTGYCLFKVSYNGQLQNINIIAENESHDGRIKLTSTMRISSSTDYDLLRIKRREIGKYNWTIIYERDVENLIGTISTVIYDKYARGRGTKYQYTIVPVTDGIEQQGAVTTIVSQFDGAYLMDKDETYFIGLDPKVSNIERIQNSAVETTLSSEYPIVFYGSKTNYYSGNFSGTIIKYNKDSDYFDFNGSVDYREKYMDWLTNQKPKVLKMWDGRAWLINVIDNISYSDDEHYNKVSISFDFVETGSLESTEDLKNSDLI